MAGFLARAGPGLENLLLLLNPTYLLLALFNSIVLWQQSVSRTRGKFNTSLSPARFSWSLSFMMLGLQVFQEDANGASSCCPSPKMGPKARALCPTWKPKMEWNSILSDLERTWRKALSDIGVAIQFIDYIWNTFRNMVWSANLPQKMRIHRFSSKLQQFIEGWKTARQYSWIWNIQLCESRVKFVPIDARGLHSCKSDPFCQGAATISMKLVQPYRGPWASQRWTAIWRLCPPIFV